MYERVFWELMGVLLRNPQPFLGGLSDPFSRKRLAFTEKHPELFVDLVKGVFRKAVLFFGF